MASSATEERTNGQGGNAAAEDEGNGQSESGAKKALKIGALAAAAGTAAYAASKAMTPSESQDEGESKDGGGGGGRTSMEQIVSAIGNSRWDVLRDLVVPFAESGARSAGTYVATEAPDFLGETLVPKFIEGFVEAKGKKITSSD